MPWILIDHPIYLETDATSGGAQPSDKVVKVVVQWVLNLKRFVFHVARCETGEEVKDMKKENNMKTPSEHNYRNLLQ